MMVYKYQLGTLLVAKNGDLGYIQGYGIGFNFDPQYYIYWFKHECLSSGVTEQDVGVFIKLLRY